MESPPVYRPELPWGGLGDMGRTMHGGMASTMMGSLNHAGALHMCTAAVRRSWGGSSPSPMFKSHAVASGYGGGSRLASGKAAVTLGAELEDLDTTRSDDVASSGRRHHASSNGCSRLSNGGGAKGVGGGLHGALGGVHGAPPMPHSIAAEDLDPSEIRMSTRLSMSSGTVTIFPICHAPFSPYFRI